MLPEEMIVVQPNGRVGYHKFPGIGPVEQTERRLPLGAHGYWFSFCHQALFARYAHETGPRCVDRVKAPRTLPVFCTDIAEVIG